MRLSAAAREAQQWQRRHAELEAHLAEEQAVNKKLVLKKKKEMDVLQLVCDGFDHSGFDD